MQCFDAALPLLLCGVFFQISTQFLSLIILYCVLWQVFVILCVISLYILPQQFVGLHIPIAEKMSVFILCCKWANHRVYTDRSRIYAFSLHCLTSWCPSGLLMFVLIRTQNFQEWLSGPSVSFAAQWTTSTSCWGVMSTSWRSSSSASRLWTKMGTILLARRRGNSTSSSTSRECI